MIKNIVLACIFTFYLNANEDLTTQKQNTLYVQNLIEIEENIAKSFEKYILTEFKIPTMTNLISDDYLGINFSVKNRMGVDIDFLSTNNLKIKYLITKDEYRSTQDYIVQLYNRDLYRNLTSVYFEEDTNSKVITANSYIEMSFDSDEAKNIFELLKSGKTIDKVCPPTSAIDANGIYCNQNQKAIRWYISSSKWIEYSKKDFNKGNVILSEESLLSNSKLGDLIVGAYIFISGEKYVKFANGTTVQILKVD